MNRRDVDNYEDPPPPYESLSDPRPPPPDGNPAFASGRPNGLDAWDFNHAPRRRPSQAGDVFFDTYDVREIDDYLADPFAPPSAPGRPIVVKGGPPIGWYYCHHKVFPAYWRCPRCPPHDCFNRWDIAAMLDKNRHDLHLPSCPRPNCSGTATEETFLVNAQKEDIMTVSGANLMDSRARDSWMWCCRCHSLRGYNATDANGCAHCADCKQNPPCQHCVKCNKFLEPTRLAPGDMVYKGVLDLHARAVAVMEGRSPDAIAKCNSRVLDDMHEHLLEGADWEKAYRVLTLSSYLVVMGLVTKLETISQRAREQRRPSETASAPPLIINVSPPTTAREPISREHISREPSPQAREPIDREPIDRERVPPRPIIITPPSPEPFRIRPLQFELQLHRRTSTSALYSTTQLRHRDLHRRPSLYSNYWTESLRNVEYAAEEEEEEEERAPRSRSYYERWMRATRYRDWIGAHRGQGGSGER